jgi:hypothetical protein
MRSPRGPRLRMPSPDRYIPSVRADRDDQCSSFISTPAGVNQARSFTPSPSSARPWKNARCRNTGWSRRSRSSDDTRSTNDVPPDVGSGASADQSSHDSSLSWQ